MTNVKQSPKLYALWHGYRKAGNIYRNSHDFHFPIKDDERPLFSSVIIGFIVNNWFYSKQLWSIEDRNV